MPFIEKRAHRWFDSLCYIPGGFVSFPPLCNPAEELQLRGLDFNALLSLPVGQWHPLLLSHWWLKNLLYRLHVVQTCTRAFS